jgi:hypothetical protein
MSRRVVVVEEPAARARPRAAGRAAPAATYVVVQQRPARKAKRAPRLVVVKRGVYHANVPRLKPFKAARPSPGVSATLFAPGAVRRGNDGALWTVRRAVNGTHRWVRA